MADHPADRDPDDDPGRQQPNPFAGTPFEQVFSAFGGGAGGAAGQVPDLGALFGQMQQMMKKLGKPRATIASALPSGVLQ